MPGGYASTSSDVVITVGFLAHGTQAPNSVFLGSFLAVNQELGTFAHLVHTLFILLTMLNAFSICGPEGWSLKLEGDLLSLLLKDHTTSTPTTQHNIFWATNDYQHLGNGFGYDDEITPENITGKHSNIIQPRVLKAQETQRGRSRTMAEVFTPAWVCNAQNNLIDAEWFGRTGVFNVEHPDHSWEVNPNPITFPSGKTWQDYVRDVRLEITCGEAPYLVSRYDSTTGTPINIAGRIGLLDRKLRVVSENTEESGEWLDWARAALKSIYGFEWQGDNLLLARENMLATFADYYHEKFGKMPRKDSMEYAAYIISWNIFQMDGLKGVVPGTCHNVVESSIFDGDVVRPCPGCTKEGPTLEHNGVYCLVRDWNNNKQKIKFIDVIMKPTPA